jgi:hypothetical protein
MSTVTPPPSSPTPDPDHHVLKLLRYLFGDRHPALWGLIYLGLVLGFALGAIWMVAPYLGDAAGLLAGGGTAAGGGAIAGAVRRRRRRKDRDDQ